MRVPFIDLGATTREVCPGVRVMGDMDALRDAGQAFELIDELPGAREAVGA